VLHEKETYHIVGAAMEVHRLLGQGFTEPVYQEGFERMLQKKDIPYEREKQLPVYMGDVKLDIYFKPDFVCYNQVIVELKAVKEILPEHEAQLINYLKASGLQVGILLNFGEESLKVVRRYFSHHHMIKE
jgi:GxxExxY protein